MATLVRYEANETFSSITLDDGKANVMSPAMLEQLNAALDRAQSDKTVVVLAGREGMFSGGFDLAVFKQDSALQLAMLQAGAETAERLLSFPAPVVIACTGHAIAMGVFLLLGGDVRLGIADVPSKICLNEVQIGMTLPRFAVEVCRHRLARPHFDRATITAEVYDPRRAVDAGFLDYLVPRAELLPAARDKAMELSKLVRTAHLATKMRVRGEALRALRLAIELDVEEWSRRPARPAGP